MKSAVLDASVILKWYLIDETYGQKALDLLHKFITRELTILSPSLLEYEVINRLIIAQKRGRVINLRQSRRLDKTVNRSKRIENHGSFYPNIFS